MHIHEKPNQARDYAVYLNALGPIGEATRGAGMFSERNTIYIYYILCIYVSHTTVLHDVRILITLPEADACQFLGSTSAPVSSNVSY